MSDRVALVEPSLRILHVLRAPLGGLFRHVLDLTREQVSRGHRVGLVVDSTTCGENAARTLAALEPALELGILRLPMRRAPHVRDLAGLLAVEAHARRLKADVIHGHGSKGGLYARAPALVRSYPHALRCYTPHGGSFNHVATPLVQALYMNVERLLARATDVLLFESVYIADCFRRRVGETEAMVRTVQNGISVREFDAVRPNPDAADLLYIGELRAAKGIDTLLDAAALLSRRLERQLNLVLVGSGPDKAKLEEQAHRVGLQDHVVFAGPLPARQAFAMGRILVVPSRAESLPYIVLEAAGAQIPMVATDVGGINEIFGPYRNRLIRPDDVDLLATRMGSMLATDPEILLRQAEDLAAFVQSRFSISIMADSVIAGYRDAAAHRATRHAQIHSYPLPS